MTNLLRHPAYRPRLRKSIGPAIAESQLTKMKEAEVEPLEAAAEEKQYTELEKVESEFLAPTVENWVETPEVASLKAKVVAWLSLGYPVHIIGPTGCGKTALAISAAKQLGRPTVWINGDMSVTTTDLIGGYSQVEQETVRDKYIHNVFKDKDILRADWVDNPLTIACKHGYTLVYNEFARTLPVANNVLLSVFEEKILELPTQFGLERFVKIDPNFRAVFTSNSVEYAGVHRPQDALLDRLVGVYMDYYGPETEAEIVRANTNLSGADAKKVVRIVRHVRSKLHNGGGPGTRACIMVGQAFSALKNPSKRELESICTDVIASKTRNYAEFTERLRVVKQAVSAAI